MFQTAHMLDYFPPLLRRDLVLENMSRGCTEEGRGARDYMDFVVSDDEPHRTLQIIQFCCHVVPFFKPNWVGETNDFELSVLSGGITNQLYKLHHRPTNAAAAVRVFGKETGRIISRDSELFYQALFLPTYGKGGNVLVYKFLEGYRALDASELPQFAELIAAALATFHLTATRSSIADHPSGEAKSRFDREQNHTEFTLREWIDASLEPETVEKILAASATRQTAADAATSSKPSSIGTFLFHLVAAKDNGEKLLGQITGAQPNDGNTAIPMRKSPIGVCHNDLLAGNVMVMRPETYDGHPVVQLIDFEYARKNFLLFDLGNHVNEYAGVECNYHETFPTDEAISRFVGNYRSHMRSALLRHTRSDDPNASGAADLAVQIFGPGGKCFFSETPEEEATTVREWVREVKFFSVCSNLGWSAWSLLQQAHSVIDFDFFAYGKARYDRHAQTFDAFTN